MRTLTLLLLCAVSFWGAESATQQPNSDPRYQQLRNITVGKEAFAASNFVLKRDAATFTFRSGTFYLLAPVNGVVTGAVFLGDGSFALQPPVASEAQYLRLLTKGEPFEETFSQLVLRFTDGTDAELRKLPPAPANPDAANGPLAESLSALRKRPVLKSGSVFLYNYSGRILQDVLSGQPGGLFFAFVKGKKYSGKMLYAIDPHGIMAGFVKLAPEEVALFTYDEAKYGVWAAFHLSNEYVHGASGTEMNWLMHIEAQKLDTEIEKSGKLNGNALTTFTSLVDGLAVVPFDLYPMLRVQSVSDAGGQPLAFIQEGKNEDSDFFVILSKPLAKGERFTIRTVYSGKDVVSNAGGGNYYLVPDAREDWYPAGYFGDRAMYEMRFRAPKNNHVIGTGVQVKEANEGGGVVSEWRTEAPMWVAGFNMGVFKHKDAKLKDGFEIVSYANETPPDYVQALQANEVSGVMAMGTLNTTQMMQQPLDEAQAAVQIYEDYFGPPSIRHLAISQQTACGFGQAWPMLVYLPVCSFLDDQVRHQLGLTDSRGYWTTVAPHEVAHQWWGTTVGWQSYRDQWMSEGFAEFSASLYVQIVYGNQPQRFLKLWRDQRDLMTEKNTLGFRAYEVGPLTMAYRLLNSRSGYETTRRLIYPKGGYILHMIRMMMWSNRTGDQNFKAAMHEFVSKYNNRAASTEDFKKVMEAYMTPEMRQLGDNLDWFFDEYVYGTAMPAYKFDSSIAKQADGSPVLKFRLEQSNVNERFAMLVPIYLEYGNGRRMRLGLASVIGNSSVEREVSLGGLKELPKSASINANYDVLCLPN